MYDTDEQDFSTNQLPKIPKRTEPKPCGEYWKYLQPRQERDYVLKAILKEAKKKFQSDQKGDMVLIREFLHSQEFSEGTQTLTL